MKYDVISKQLPAGIDSQVVRFILAVCQPDPSHKYAFPNHDFSANHSYLLTQRDNLVLFALHESAGLEYLIVRSY